MDAFCEYLMKKRSNSDRLKRIGLVFGCAVVCLLVIYLCIVLFPAAIVACPILIGAAIYGTVLLSRNYSLEYEYIFTNGILDIDVIKGRTTRKPLCSLSCRKIENMEPLPKNYQPRNALIDAIYDEKRGNKYVLTFSNKGVSTDLLFQPPEKLLEQMKKYNARNIHLAEQESCYAR